ncbi:hypothetical protein ACJJTC_017616 [Scirpophaga incertulas]
MGIKSVSQAVLRKQFSDCAKIFIEILEKNSQSENGTLLRILAFALHSKPKVRKAAQHAITAILRGSCFMVPSEEEKAKVPKLHPASNRVADYCLSQIKPEMLLSSHRTVLHTLTMLRDVLPVFSKEL